MPKNLLRYVLSPEALSEGMREGGYYCYEEDALQCIPLRELYDKGILNEDHSYFKAYHVKSEENGRIPFSSATDQEKKRFIAEWNKTINESLATWNKEYWQKYQKAEQHQKDSKNTDLTDILNQTELGGVKDKVQKQCGGNQTCQSSVCGEQKILRRKSGKHFRALWAGADFHRQFDEKNPDWQKGVH